MVVLYMGMYLNSLQPKTKQGRYTMEYVLLQTDDTTCISATKLLINLF